MTQHFLAKLTHSAANSHNKINKTWSEGLFFQCEGGKTAAAGPTIEEPQKRVRAIFISLLMCLRVC